MYLQVINANIINNQTGRLVKMQDASGVQIFSYGDMGELIETFHAILVPDGNPYTFMTKHQCATDMVIQIIHKNRF